MVLQYKAGQVRDSSQNKKQRGPKAPLHSKRGLAKAHREVEGADVLG